MEECADEALSFERDKRCTLVLIFSFRVNQLNSLIYQVIEDSFLLRDLAHINILYKIAEFLIGRTLPEFFDMFYLICYTCIG